MVEQRKRTRVEFHTTADIQTTGARVLGMQTRDLSHKGVFVLGELPLEVGQKCGVTIQLGDDESSPILHMEGRVARLTAEGVAIDFISMDPDTYMHLRHLVLLNAENPVETAKEFVEPAFPDLEGKG